MDREQARGDNAVEHAEHAAMIQRLTAAPATADQDMAAASTVFYRMIGETALLLLSGHDRADVWRRLCIRWDHTFGDPTPQQRHAVSVIAVAALHVAEQGVRSTNAGDR